MQVELSAKQLFIIKLALAQLEPVDAVSINETRQLIDSSINLYPAASCKGCLYVGLGHAKLEYYCKHFHAPGENTLDNINKSPEWCPMLNEGNSNG